MGNKSSDENQNQTQIKQNQCLSTVQDECQNYIQQQKGEKDEFDEILQQMNDSEQSSDVNYKRIKQNSIHYLNPLEQYEKFAESFDYSIDFQEELENSQDQKFQKDFTLYRKQENYQSQFQNKTTLQSEVQKKESEIKLDFNYLEDTGSFQQQVENISKQKFLENFCTEILRQLKIQGQQKLSMSNNNKNIKGKERSKIEEFHKKNDQIQSQLCKEQNVQIVNYQKIEDKLYQIKQLRQKQQINKNASQANINHSTYMEKMNKESNGRSRSQDIQNNSFNFHSQFHQISQIQSDQRDNFQNVHTTQKQNQKKNLQDKNKNNCVKKTKTKQDSLTKQKKFFSNLQQNYGNLQPNNQQIKSKKEKVFEIHSMINSKSQQKIINKKEREQNETNIVHEVSKIPIHFHQFDSKKGHQNTIQRKQNHFSRLLETNHNYMRQSSQKDLKLINYNTDQLQKIQNIEKLQKGQRYQSKAEVKLIKECDHITSDQNNLNVDKKNLFNSKLDLYKFFSRDLEQPLVLKSQGFHTSKKEFSNIASPKELLEINSRFY